MKAQFEAMGLAVIVVLISMGMLFMLFFSFDKETDVTERFGREQTAQNVVNALLDTSVEGCPLDFNGLIEDAVVWQRNPCGDSKEKIEEVANAILTPTLKDRSIPYEFTITQQSQNTISNVIDPISTCTPLLRQRDKPGRRMLSFYPSPQKATVTLSLCFQ
jgi:hypothetical protein